jgi:charged multivesicular body protein 7
MLDIMVKRPLSWSFNTFVKSPISKTYNMMFGGNGTELREELVFVDFIKVVFIARTTVVFHAVGFLL